MQISALADKSIVSVVCGQYHSLALDDDHRYAGAGYPHIPSPSHPGYARLGAGARSRHGIRVLSPPSFRVWSWGWGVHGQLGLQSADDKLVPTYAPLLDGYHVSLVAAGYGHSAVLTAEV